MIIYIYICTPVTNDMISIWKQRLRFWPAPSSHCAFIAVVVFFIYGIRFALAPRDPKHQDMDRGKHFVLVHGAGHGAWCWYKLVPLLKSFGHSVTALDLGSSGVNPKSLDELASAYDYVQPLMEFVASLPQDEKVVLVGHSYGGLPISLAMESFPQKILVAVFVSAYMPNYISPPITQAQEVSTINL